MHAYGYECGVVIGQLECHKAKTNEIPVSKDLLDMLKLKDTVELKPDVILFDMNIDWLDNKNDWKNIKAFVMCESEVTSKGNARTEKRYCIFDDDFRFETLLY